MIRTMMMYDFISSLVDDESIIIEVVGLLKDVSTDCYTKLSDASTLQVLVNALHIDITYVQCCDQISYSMWLSRLFAEKICAFFERFELAAAPTAQNPQNFLTKSSPLKAFRGRV